MPSALDRLSRVFGSIQATGTGARVALRLPDGPLRVFGEGEPEATIVAKDRRGVLALASLDVMAMGEAYLFGSIDVEGEMKRVLAIRDALKDRRPLAYAMRFIRPFLRGQVAADRATIPEHYDRDPEFFTLFLDKRHRAYSHGFFAHPDESLEDAVTRKLDTALDAVGARPGDRILDIGGGWGAMTEHGGRRGVRVTSLTISEPSRAFIQGLIDRQGLPCEVRMEHFFEHHPSEPYDGIVNLGVTEHLPDYDRTLAHYDALLKPGGKVYLDASAGRKKWDVSSFLEKYIYRGNGSLLCLHDYLRAVAGSRFEAESVVNDREDYGRTAEHWARNLDARAEEYVRRWGEVPYRLFRLYLWGCVDAFERAETDAYHLVLRRAR